MYLVLESNRNVIRKIKKFIIYMKTVENNVTKVSGGLWNLKNVSNTKMKCIMK